LALGIAAFGASRNCAALMACVAPYGGPAKTETHRCDDRQLVPRCLMESERASCPQVDLSAGPRAKRVAGLLTRLKVDGGYRMGAVLIIFPLLRTRTTESSLYLFMRREGVS
jgi:hypothetical protein